MSEIVIDPISLEIAWNGLKSIADECFISIMRSAFSTNVKERHDHSTAIADAQGRLVVQAEMALPIHLASMRGLTKFILDRYGSDIHPGDVFIANDPHVAGGTHLPDINMAMPVFEGSRLIGFVANIIHHADVGGAAVGSMSGGLDEIYKEGLRIPIMRLYSKGVLDQDLLTLLLLNMRLEEERRGDLNAQIAACKLGVARLEDMLREHGGDRISAIFREVIARTEIRMRKAIATLPDGVYAFTDFMDDDGAGTEDIKIALRIEKTGDRILFDFEGSDPQVPGNFNMVFNATQSAVCFALKALLDPNVPNNQGIFDAIEIKAPLGSFVNCIAPAAVALRANSCQRVVDCVFGALAEQVPDRVVAGTNGANTSAVFAGIDPRTAQLYVYLETLGGGMGARATFDGKDGVQVNITNTSNLPVEAIELEYPLRVEEYSLIENTGGAGRYRGGLGIRRTIRPIDHVCEFNGVGERFVHKPWGLFGGEDGATGRFYVRSDAGQVTELAAKACCVRLEPDAVAVLETAGAGGYGPPAERLAAAIQEDLASGKFSEEYVKRHYSKAS
ncbi:hydantoinase B/oxoprolinase family protein [Bradyrhizobium sp. CCGB12]|uniref:hydantoinase B/oxoprolinase family protein n=1 Tax=Bradyrhizobium sp. CCGB12 TaxID=2949632 RepID=UPI0020B1D33F|nr:hydantoinase B/oxoprolinase family protein [Bradyrhizobium sp. CCGB12]MCP3395048.1 hydantoinase B/oxoprolinase family protein [Bradyrhizobium sp. CCGB12]